MIQEPEPQGQPPESPPSQDESTNKEGEEETVHVDEEDNGEEYRLREYVETSGTLVRAEEAGLDYGTHGLDGLGPEILYALRSEEVDLDQYVGEQVWLRGRIIAGYPRNGGPEFIQVESATPFQ